MTERYDVVVIGAGIHGAGVAQAAAAAGYSVRVLEQTDIAAWTSSRSSKLIHGGLRYLESAQLSLVRESLRERALLLKLAPALVQLRRFHIPIYSETTRRPWQLRLGLSLYAMLARGARAGGFDSVPRRQWSELDGLETEHLQHVFRYSDAQTDDRALTRAVMRSAEHLGAELRMPASFVHAEITGQECAVAYTAGGVAGQCVARVLVNAAGAWVNDVAGRVRPGIGRLPVDLVQGTHLLVEGRLERGIYYLEAPSDRRAVFAMPWLGRILVGTTETVFTGDPATVAPLDSECRYLVATLAHYFPRFRGHAEVVDAFAGLRVLPAGSSAAFTRSRETVLHPDRAERPRVLSIYGGKLTTYRATAEKVMRRIRPSLPDRRARASTDRLMLEDE